MDASIAKLIADKTDLITEHVVTAGLARHPELSARYGEEGLAHCRRDTDYHLAFLADAVAVGETPLFVDYVGWAKSMLAARGIPATDLMENLRLLRDALAYHLPEDTAKAAMTALDAALAELPGLPTTPTSFISADASNGELAQAFLDCLLQGDRRGAGDLIEGAIAEGVPLERIYLDVFQQSQRELGRLWQLNLISAAKEHYCTAATLSIMNRFYGAVLDTPRNGYKVTAFCVSGDLHEIGLRIVADFFELDGWDCDYIGANTPSESLLQMIEADPPDLIAVSATMAHQVHVVAEFIKSLRANSTIAALPVLVGGRPFLVAEDLWCRIGADGTAADAETATARGLALVRARRSDG